MLLGSLKGFAGLDRSPSVRPSGYFAIAIVGCGLALGGCAVADIPLIGVPANAPARPEVTGAYPAVHDMPPPRVETTLTTAEQTKIEQELMESRNRQNANASAPVAASSKPAKKKSASAATR